MIYGFYQSLDFMNKHIYVTISVGDLVIPDEQWTNTLWFYIFIKLFKWIAP
jgi:hypothetical protein